jgi:phage terminase large subunit-like protein
MKQPVPVREVEEYLMQLNSKFKFKQISFDQWGSLETLEKLKANGLPVVLKVFNKEYKDKIYLKLLEVFRDKRITFYKISSGQVRDLNNKIMDINEIPEARNQFMFLQKKWRNGRQQIEALTGYKDDICDAVAAAVYEADADMIAYKSLPRARIAYTGRGFR